MSGNSFGEIFKVTTFGESHGAALGAVIDGVPANLQLDASFIQHELDRRRPGQSAVATARNEADQVEIDSEKGLEKLTKIHMKELENRARETLSRRVRITNTGKKKTVELTFEDNEDLEALLKILCGQDFFNNEQF